MHQLYVSVRGVLPRAGFLCAVLGLMALAANIARADVVPNGDVTPATLATSNQFGGNVSGTIIIGGTGQRIGGTATGQMTIDIPSDTDPLVSDDGIIGGNLFGLGLVNVVELNSEWDLNNRLIVGSEGQGTLQVQSGARVVTAFTQINSTPISLPNTPSGDTATGGYDYIMGQWEGSQGFATVDGFASLLLTGHAAIGFRGFGRVDVTNGGRFVTIGRGTVGNIDDPTDAGLGDGYVLVDGQGSRWTVGLAPNSAGGQDPDSINGTLFVGRQGRGTVEISNQGVVRVEQDTFVGGGTGVPSPINRAYGRISIDGANSQFQTLRNMFLGDPTGATVAELYITDNGQARIDGGPSASGGLTVGPRGLVNMAAGTLLSPNITNSGVLRGDGRVQGDVVNLGDIRNAAAIADQRERLLFTGTVNNNTGAIIESVGGEMEFQDTVTNDGLIYGKNAIFRFKADTVPLTGGGDMTLDNTIVESLLGVPLPVAALTLAPNKSQVLGSIDLGGLNVTLGNPFSQLAVTGDANIGGVLDVSLKSDYTPKIGDSFEILDAASRNGVFSAVTGVAAPGGFWNVSYTPTSVFLNFAATVGQIFASDFNGDGTVNGADLAVWQMNLGLMPATNAQGDANGDGKVDGSDFIIWQHQNGSTFPAVAAAAPVPEPGALMLALVALAPLACRRK